MISIKQTVTTRINISINPKTPNSGKLKGLSLCIILKVAVLYMLESPIEVTLKVTSQASLAVRTVIKGYRLFISLGDTEPVGERPVKSTLIKLELPESIVYSTL